MSTVLIQFKLTPFSAVNLTRHLLVYTHKLALRTSFLSDASTSFSICFSTPILKFNLYIIQAKIKSTILQMLFLFGLILKVFLGSDSNSFEKIHLTVSGCGFP